MRRKLKKLIDMVGMSLNGSTKPDDGKYFYFVLIGEKGSDPVCHYGGNLDRQEMSPLLAAISAHAAGMPGSVRSSKVVH